MFRRIPTPTIFSNKQDCIRVRVASAEEHLLARRALQVGCTLSCMAAVTAAGDGEDLGAASLAAAVWSACICGGDFLFLALFSGLLLERPAFAGLPARCYRSRGTRHTWTSSQVLDAGPAESHNREEAFETALPPS